MNRKNLRYGMVILSLFLFAGAGPGLLFNTFTAFVKPVSDGLGYARTQISLIYTIELLGAIALTPFYGRLFKRVNVRRMLLVCGGVCMGVLFGYSFSTKLWQLYLLAGIFGLAYNGISFAAFGTLAARWFTKKQNLVTGIATSGTGVLPSLLLPVVNQINAVDWRTGYRLVGAVAAVSLVTACLLIRNDPAEVGLEPYGGAETGEEERKTTIDSYEEAVKQPVLWLFFLMSIISFVVLIGINQNCVAYLSDLGFGPAAAGAASSILMIGISAGKILVGWMYDHLSFRMAMTVVAVMQLTSPVMLLFAHIPPVAYTAAAVNGMAAGAATVQASSFSIALFGRRDYSRIYALALLPNLFRSAIGPALGSAIFDLLGDYRWAWALCILLSLVGLVLCLAVSRLETEKRR